jgi:hypothetical protein
MTFTLVRLGLPNSIAVLALAMVPILSIAMASAGRVDVVRSHNPDTTVVAGIDSDRADAFIE